MSFQKIIHIRCPQYKGAITIVSELHKEPNQDGYIKYGVAYSSPKDTFVKKIGIKLAKQRVENSKFLPVYTNRYNNNVLLMSIISDLILTGTYPRFARKILLHKAAHFNWCW